MLSTLLLASNRTDNFLYDTKLKTIDNTITEIKEINLEFWYFSINEFESASEIKPLLIRLFKFEILLIKKLLT